MVKLQNPTVPTNKYHDWRRNMKKKLKNGLCSQKFTNKWIDRPTASSTITLNRPSPIWYNKIKRENIFKQESTQSSQGLFLLFHFITLAHLFPSFLEGLFFCFQFSLLQDLFRSFQLRVLSFELVSLFLTSKVIISTFSMSWKDHHSVNFRWTTTVYLYKDKQESYRCSNYTAS